MDRHHKAPVKFTCIYIIEQKNREIKLPIALYFSLPWITHNSKALLEMWTISWPLICSSRLIFKRVEDIQHSNLYVWLFLRVFIYVARINLIGTWRQQLLGHLPTVPVAPLSAELLQHQLISTTTQGNQHPQLTSQQQVNQTQENNRNPEMYSFHSLML